MQDGRRSLVVMSVLTALLVTGCDLFGTQQPAEKTPDLNYDNLDSYPTTIRPLSSERLRACKREYEALNENICSSLNKFGFTEWDLSSCFGREESKLNAISNQKVVSIAKAFLLKNRQFTGVTDTSRLNVDRIHRHEQETDSAALHVHVNFRNQRYEGLEVKDTWTKVAMDGQGVYLAGGHWYPNIFIPEVDHVDRQEARTSLIGETFSYSDWTGRKTHRITQESFSEEARARKIVLPVKKNDAIELHVVWEIGVVYFDEHPGWYIFVDTTTGERLDIEQLVEF